MASIAQLQAGGVVDDLEGFEGGGLIGEFSVGYPEVAGFAPGDELAAGKTHVPPSAVSYTGGTSNL